MATLSKVQAKLANEYNRNKILSAAGIDIFMFDKCAITLFDQSDYMHALITYWSCNQTRHEIYIRIISKLTEDDLQQKATYRKYGEQLVLLVLANHTTLSGAEITSILPCRVAFIRIHS